MFKLSRINLRYKAKKLQVLPLGSKIINPKGPKLDFGLRV